MRLWPHSTNLEQPLLYYMAVWEIEHIVNHVRREHSYVQAIVPAIVPLASLANLPTSMLHAHALALAESSAP